MPTSEEKSSTIDWTSGRLRFEVAMLKILRKYDSGYPEHILGINDLCDEVLEAAGYLPKSNYWLKVKPKED